MAEDSQNFPHWMLQLGERAAQPDFQRWRQMVASTGGCARPIRLIGTSTTVDPASGEVLGIYSTDDEPTGYVLTACGNRRASRCESCARLYADDTFHLIRSGLAGGRDVPASVTTHPRVFATFTAPSFGPVHSRMLTGPDTVRPCHPRRDGPSCALRHGERDGQLSQAIDPDSYDYRGAVLWNSAAAELWHVFAVYLRRQLAERVGVPRSRLGRVLRVEYAKVAEYQARGLVHFHAVIRLDGPAGPAEPPPFGVNADELNDAITEAARTAAVQLPGDRVVRWGRQLDLRPIYADEAAAGWTDQQVARYIAKYATKGAEAAGTVHHQLRSIKNLHHIRGLSPHARRMIEACWELGDEASYHDRNLRQWAHMLGYGGHFSTKSRRYSTTLGTIRGDRARFRADEARAMAGEPPLPDGPLQRDGDWRVVGTGYRTSSEETWAEIIRAKKREQPLRHRPDEPDQEAS